jgi:D-tyrosyl-tRNA(Tyr) deacylase
MKAVVQRVSRASVRIDGQTVGEIGRGLLVLLGLGKDDTASDADWMIKKLLALRIFPDDAKNMNRSVTDIGGGILVVSQFTLYGDTRKGTRPSFSDAMPPADAERFYNEFMTKLRAATPLPVAEGKFAAMMDVELVNDGPVTILLESAVGQASRPPEDNTAAQEPHNSNLSPPTSAGETPAPLFMPFDPQSLAEIHTRRLPHWEQPGCTYFVTFRLADSLPQDKLSQWYSQRTAWLKQHPPPLGESEISEYQRLFPDRLEQWLDAGYGECLLRSREVAEILEGALRHFHGQRYTLGEFVIMPNHVHALVTPLGEQTLAQIIHSWKSYTAHEINRVLGRSGPVWQDEYFDHVVRNAQCLERFATYMAQNPILGRASRPPDSSKRHGRDARATKQ